MPREMRWFDTNISMATLASSGGIQVRNLVGGVTIEEGRRATVTRIILTMTSHSVTVAGAWGVSQLAFGIGIVSEDAFVAGGAAIPSPIVNAEFPPTGWLLREEVSISQNGVGGQVVFQHRWDIRAQRKLGMGVLILQVINTAITGTAFAVGVHGQARVLCRLP